MTEHYIRILGKCKYVSLKNKDYVSNEWHMILKHMFNK